MKSCLIIFSLFCTSIIFSQRVNWSPEYESDRAKESFRLIGETKSNLFLSRTIINGFYIYLPSKIFLERYNKETKAIDLAKEIELPGVNGRNPALCDIRILNETLLLFFQVREENVKKVYAQKLKEDFSFNDSPVLLSEITDVYKSGILMQEVLPFEAPIIIFSPDSSSFYCFQAGLSKSDDKKEFICCEYNSDLKLLSRKQNVLPIDLKKFKVKSLLCDKKGIIYCLVKSCGPKIDIDFADNFNMDLIITDGKVLNKVPIASEFRMREIDAVLDKNGNVLVGGLFGTMKYYNHVIGYFYGRFNVDSKKSNIKFEKFNKEFEEKLYFEPLYLKNLIATDDDGLLIVFTKGFSGQNVSMKAGYGIGVLKINKDLGTDWAKCVTQKQLPKNGYHFRQIGFDAHYMYTNLVLVFNDHPENISVDSPDLKGCRWKEISTVCVTFNEKGEGRKKILCKYSDSDDPVFFPGLGLNAGGLKSHYLYNGNKEKYKIGELVFE